MSVFAKCLQVSLVGSMFLVWGCSSRPLEESPAESAGLPGEWQVFLDVEPEASVPWNQMPETLPGQKGTPVAMLTVEGTGKLDFLELSGGDATAHHARRRVLLYGEVESERARTVHLTASSDWWMTWYLNGGEVYTTKPKGNAGQADLLEQHIFTLELQPGKNLLAVEVLSGTAGWNLTYATSQFDPSPEGLRRAFRYRSLRFVDDWNRRHGLVRLPERGERPRLIVTDTFLDHLHEWKESDPRYAELLGHIRKTSDAICEAEPLEMKLVGDKRKRLLSTSRAVLSRVSVLGISWFETKDPKYALALKREILNACRFPHWHPRHFLDTAEMSAAVGLGYDWIYDQLTQEEREEIVRALIEKALYPAAAYKPRSGWAYATNNWNQVCNGGIIIAALAIFEHEPELASYLITRAQDGMPKALEAYAPQGVYPEGPGYWFYGTSYSILTAAALQSAGLPADPILDAPGFRESFEYYRQMFSPTGLAFNYADGSAQVNKHGSAMHMFMATPENGYGPYSIEMINRDFARRDQQGIEAPYLPLAENRAGSWINPLAAIWYRPENAAPDAAEGEAPPPAYFADKGETVHLAVLRGARAYAGIKGGELEGNHSHLDAGAFVYDVLGERWAVDLGVDRAIYDRNDSWGREQESLRWKFYRANNFSHNTLTLQDQIHRVDGIAPLVRHSEEDKSATFDLSQAFAGQAKKVMRTVRLLEDDSLLVRDEITAEPGTQIQWTLVTPARVEVAEDGQSATLRLGDSEIRVVQHASSFGRFTAAPATAPAYGPKLPEGISENPNEGYTALVYRGKAAQKVTESAVTLGFISDVRPELSRR